MLIQFEGLKGLYSGMFDSKDNGNVLGAINEAENAKLLQGFSKGLRGAGIKKNSSFELSDSLIAKLKEAQNIRDSGPVVEKEASIPTPKLSDPQSVDWEYLHKRIIELAQKQRTILKDTSSETEDSELA